MGRNIFFVEIKGKYVCLLCGSTVAVSKKNNIERHFQTNHNSFTGEYLLNSEVRKSKVAGLKVRLAAKQSVFF